MLCFLYKLAANLSVFVINAKDFQWVGSNPIFALIFDK